MIIPAISLCENGPAISRIILGMWRLADWQYSISERSRLIHASLESGITSFDHADIYGDHRCESLFGEVLGSEPDLRHKIQLITKCGIRVAGGANSDVAIQHYDTSHSHITSSVEASLRNLCSDHIDVLLLHRPDALLDADAVADTFIKLQDAGKVLHFGVSNFNPGQFDLLQSRLPFPLVSNQVECSVLAFDVMHDGTIDHCQRLRRSPMAWSPLGRGRLFTGKDHQTSRVRAALKSIGAELGGIPIDQVALAWLLEHPSRIIPILGTGKINRVRSAIESVELHLTNDQWYDMLLSPLFPSS